MIKKVIFLLTYLVVTDVFGQLVADFSLSVNQGCVPLTVSFKNNSTGNPVSYEWDFGNANKSILTNPSAIYYKSGNFTVSLKITDANGNTATKTFKSIRVFNNPVAAFVSDTVACVNEQVTFKDMSTKADTIITDWQWDFGDGNLGSSNQPKHAYANSNTYTIGLTITDGFGCKSLITKKRHVRIKTTPVPSYTINKDYECNPPLSFTTNNTSINATNSYWECSDGTTSSYKNFSHTINNYGTYTVTLNAINGTCTAKLSSKVVIEKLKPNFNIPSQACENEIIKPANNSGPETSSTSYEWDFGDGTTSNLKSPSKFYDTKGTYTIKLKMTNGDCVEEISKTISINPSPQAYASIVDSVGCKAPFKAQFTVIGTEYTSSVWKWGDKNPDENISNFTNISHVYNKFGTYQVSVTLYSNKGCSLVLNAGNVHVGMQKIKVIPEQVEDCVPKLVNYDLQLTLKDPIKSIEWYFTDSSAAKYNTQKVNKTFYKPGNFMAIAKVTTTKNCVLIDTGEVSVGLRFKPTFKLDQDHICNEGLLTYTNTTHDSIKKKVRFELITVNDSGEYKNSESRLYTKVGGKHKLNLIAIHFGCRTPSDTCDTVMVHGPYPRLTTVPLNCQNTSIKITTDKTWANRSMLTFPTDTFYRDTTFIYHYKSDKQNIIVYTAYNDTFNCKDSSIYRPSLPFYDVGFNFSQDKICAPSKLTVSHSGSLKNGKWDFGNNDTITSLKQVRTYNNPGQYKVYLTGLFGDEECPDTNFVIINVKGVPSKSSVKKIGNCMPFKLDLHDSSYGTDNTDREWVINGEIYPISNKSMSIDFTSFNKESDSFVTVYHVIKDNSSCITSMEYKIPVIAHSVGYDYRRNNNCDTPIFYFESKVVDGNSTVKPYSYLWKFEDGRTFNQETPPPLKFKKIGYNYFTYTVTDNNGCKSIISDSFEVSPNMLQPSFKADPIGRFCPPLLSTFYDQSKTFRSEIVNWDWDFGDGTGSKLQNPKKLYLLPGKYDITLTVVSLSGCTATLKKPAYVIVSGPRGSYDFDRLDGCKPLKIEFRGKTIDSAAMEWDLGDGVVKEGNNFKHIYNRPGRYIPAMILSDTLGCKYTLPPIDTIDVFDFPVANFDVKGICYHDVFKVKNNSESNHENASIKSYWKLNQDSLPFISDSTFKVKLRGNNQIELIVENKATCKDTLVKQFKVYGPQALFEADKTILCVGENSAFQNRSKFDTTFVSYSWDFGDNNTSTIANPKHLYNSPGQYNISLIAKDVLGCQDTLFKPAGITVGDTLPPQMIPIRRASVINNNTTELCFSQFPNFDFRKYIIYKEYNGRYLKTAEVNGRNDTVFYDAFCQTLNNSYCYKIATQNLCYKVSDLKLSKPHCTIETKAYGKFEHNQINWSPYIGFDSVANYEIWRKPYNSESDYSYIDKVNGNVLTYTDTQIQCFTRQNYRIVAKEFSGFNEFSKSDTAIAKPFYINTNTPNYAWRATVENNDYARVEWLTNAWSRNGIKAYLLTKTRDDGSTLFKDKLFEVNDSTYDDHQTNVQKNSYIYTVKAIDGCNDTTPVSNVAQTILLKAHFDVNTQKPALSWNLYQLWSQGVDHYEIEQKQIDGSFKVIGKVASNINSFIDLDASTNCTPSYIYRVTAYSLNHEKMNSIASSISNEAQCFPGSKLFMPNAFSPNRNNINETFGPVGQYIVKYDFEIYNRWGEKVYSTNDCMQHWDGKFKGEICPQEVYLYKLKALGADGVHYQLQATFHLLE